MLDIKCPLQTFRRDELIVDYCAGALDPETTARFEGHISSCVACSSTVAEQKVVWAVLDEWRDMFVYSVGSTS